MSKKNNPQPEELWRLPRVLQAVQVGRSHWWNLVRQGIAPAPLKISHRVSLWKSSDIQGFIQRLIDEVGV